MINVSMRWQIKNRAQINTHYLMRFSNRILNSVRGSLDKKILCLHIPKCAGSSLTNAVVKNYISLNLREDSRIIRMQAEVVANTRQILSDENTPEYSVADD